MIPVRQLENRSGVIENDYQVEAMEKVILKVEKVKGRRNNYYNNIIEGR